MVENTPFINTYEVVNSSNRLNTIRLIGMNWDSSYNIEDSSILDRMLTLRGIDNKGYETLMSVLSGNFHSAIMRQMQLANYQSVWADLNITYNTLVVQYTVTFVNTNGDTLDVQYVDKGSKPVNPITREDNPIPVPTIPSTVEYDYTFAGWDSSFVDTFQNTIITATYTATTRKYTVKYMSHGEVLQETMAEYGTIVLYEGDIPTYTYEEQAYKYYLFDRWDKSGYVNGDKVINAVYDSCEYTSNYFDGKDISTLKPVEIYAMIQMGLESQYVESKDAITISLGDDISYEDIEENILIAEPTVFNGSNYIDTNEQLFSEDRDFVLAIDYKMQSTTNNSVLAQCYSDNGMNGFKLWYSNEVKLSWSNSATSPSNVNDREMLVIRHIKGERGLYVYSSNTSGTSIKYVELTGTRIPIHNNSLVFGCSKADDGAYENFSAGTIYWSKVWYGDLGDNICRKIANWPHETITFEMCGFKRYYLSDNSSKRCSMSFLASTPLAKNYSLNKSGATAGGWGAWTLYDQLNTRLYSAFPPKWKQLIKKVGVKSSLGNKSTEIGTFNCYIAIPALIELDATKTSDPYNNEGTYIDYFKNDEDRILYNENGTAVYYWTRTPNVSYTSYAFLISDGGYTYSINSPSTAYAVRIMISI